MGILSFGGRCMVKKRQPIEAHICAILLIFLTIILFIEIILRYFFNSSLIWGEEMARYLFVWFVYVSMSYAIVVKSHIKIDSMMRLLPEKYRLICTQIGIVVWIVFAGVIIYFTMNYVIEAFLRGHEAIASGIPMWLIYLGIPVGFLLSIIRLLIEFIQNFKLLKYSRDGE